MVCWIFFKDCFELKYCGRCQQWIGDAEFPDHMKMENVGLNSDAIEHKQYTGNVESVKNDYMICVLHQKKCPCPIKKCKYTPFGMIRKSLMMLYFRDGWWKWHHGFGNDKYVRIDIDTKIVVLFGVPIKLRI